jgi:hypothetical protein
MSISFSLGSCAFNESQWMEDGRKVGLTMQPRIVR